MLYWPFWRWDDSQKDRYGTVGTGFGAGTGAGTVQVRYGYGTWVRYGYGTWVRLVRYIGTKTVPTYRTHVPNVPYPLLSVPKVPCTQIAAEIAADQYHVPVPYLYRTHVLYPYRTCTVSAPAPKPVPPVPYPSKPLGKTPSYPTS